MTHFIGPTSSTTSICLISALSSKLPQDLNLDGNLARQIIEQRSFREAVDADWERARQLGITGVPTFYKNDLAVVGCQPYETLERFVQHLMQTQCDD